MAQGELQGRKCGDGVALGRWPHGAAPTSSTRAPRTGRPGGAAALPALALLLLVASRRPAQLAAPSFPLFQHRPLLQPYTLKELTQLIAVSVNKKARTRLTKLVEELKGGGGTSGEAAGASGQAAATAGGD